MSARLAVGYSHGTRRAYCSLRCRCLPCREANTAYEIARRRDAVEGRSRTVPADAARAHLAFLKTQGIGIIRVSQLCGLDPESVSWIRSGRTRRILAATAAKLLAVPAAPARVDARPSRRLVAELVRRGHTQSAIAAMLGQRTKKVQLKYPTVHRRTAERIEKLHAHLLGGDA